MGCRIRRGIRVAGYPHRPAHCGAGHVPQRRSRRDMVVVGLAAYWAALSAYQTSSMERRIMTLCLAWAKMPTKASTSSVRYQPQLS